MTLKPLLPGEVKGPAPLPFWPHFYQLLNRLVIGTLLFREFFLIYTIDNSGPNQTSLRGTRFLERKQGCLLVLCVWELF